MPRTLADLMADRFGLPVAPESQHIPQEDTLARMLQRRIHRQFRPDPVPDALLNTLLACALSAPSKSDLQQGSIIVVNDPAKRATIASWIPSMPWIAEAARFLIFCGDNRRLRRISEWRKKPFPNDTLDMFMNAAVDAGLVLQTFILAAEATGLGCCPISVVRNHVFKLAALLELPAGVFPVAGLCIGYPATPGTLSMRLPMQVTVHTDRYDDTHLQEHIDAYDARREARTPTSPQQQRYPERYGYAEPYGWSEDKARQYSVPERLDFGKFVRGQGFSLT